MNSYERQARRLLHAYPAPWRDERGEEMVGTLLDLAGDGRQRVPARVALDLLVGGWTERAHRHVRSTGPLRAGWRVAAGIAVVAQLVVSLVWLRDWALTGTPGVLPHMLGGLSAVTYGIALNGFVIGAVAWLTGRAPTARVAARVAIIAWLVTFGVFTALSNPIWYDWLEPLVWTYLAAIATLGMHQPPPAHRRAASSTALLVVLASQLLGSGVGPITHQGQIAIIEHVQIPIALLDRGADTLHTALRSGWTLFTIAALALARIDPRPLFAAGWLLPFLALDHLYWSEALGLATGVLTGGAVIVWALVLSRSLRPDQGPDLTT